MKVPEGKILKAHSRYGEPRYETYLGNGAYLLEGPSRCTRSALPSQEELFHTGMMPDDLAMVDFEGGPDLYVTSTYYPGPANKRTKQRLRITKLEFYKSPEPKENWAAVIIYTKELGK